MTTILLLLLVDDSFVKLFMDVMKRKLSRESWENVWSGRTNLEAPP